jgi:AcrR family transcriptional regulator
MSSPGLRERKKQKTRWAIQEHAVRLFAQQGYEATTVEQIAEAAEISPSTFFRYFKTKEDVVIQDRYDDMIAAAIRAADPSLSAGAALRHAVLNSFGQIGPEEIEQIKQRTRLTFSVPALRMRSIDNLLLSIDNLAGPMAERLGRDPGDHRVRAFVGACLGAMISALTVWTADGMQDDIMPLLDEALSVVTEGP